MPELVSYTIEKADKALERDLCDHCLGRLFARVNTGLSNEQRGQSARMGVALIRSMDDQQQPTHSTCWVCDDLFDSVPRFADAVIEKLQDSEFDNFLIGTRVDPSIQEREERLWSEVGGEKAEPIKGELNREIGKLVEERLGVPAEFEKPDVVALVDTRFAHVELDVSPLFIYGRYRKYSREIPQTRWPCRVCQGKGCPRCGGMGKMYQTSVQEIIGDPILKATEGADHFFHGMGREDIDARMLGNGRPFVIEIREPKKRHLDLEAMQRIVNHKGKDVAEVSDLRKSSREEVRRVKLAAPDKTYRAVVSLQDKVNKEKVNEAVKSLKNTRITQQTPSRVAHRRADLAREREILDLQVESMEDSALVLVMKTTAGTYVKEFVNGDEGRTVPSLSAALGVPATVTALDVVHISDGANEG